MGPDTENHESSPYPPPEGVWVMKSKRNSYEGTKARLAYLGMTHVDLRFAFHKGAEVLLARGVKVSDITETHFDMIVAWREVPRTPTCDWAPIFTWIPPAPEEQISELREIANQAFTRAEEFIQSGTPNRRQTRSHTVRPEVKPAEPRQYPHYFKDVRHLTYIDVYQVLNLWGVTDPAISHAIKKLLVSGGRGAKDQDQDVREAIDSLVRQQEMREERKE